MMKGKTMFKEHLKIKERLFTGVFSKNIVDEMLEVTFNKNTEMEELAVSEIFPLGGFALKKGSWELDALKLPDDSYLLIDRKENYRVVSGLFGEYRELMSEYREYLEEQRQLLEESEEKRDKSLDMLEADSTKHATLDTLEEDSTNHLTMEKLHEEEGIECQ